MAAMGRRARAILLLVLASSTLVATKATSGQPGVCTATEFEMKGSAFIQNEATTTRKRSQGPDPFMGIYIITVTGIPNIDLAATMQKSVLNRMRPEDTLVHICDQGCAAKANGTLQGVVEIDDAVFAKGKCLMGSEPPGTLLDCDGYTFSQMKFPFGLIHQVGQAHMTDSRRPAWWMIKDDDTYLHVPNLMKSIEGYHPTDLVAFSSSGFCQGTCGGAGLLLSNALAEKLAFEHGERWLRLMNDVFMQDPLYAYYDMHIPEVVSWVQGAKIFWLPAMQVFDPTSEQCHTTAYIGANWTLEERKHSVHGEAWHAVVHPLPGSVWGRCFFSQACECSYSPHPATWHVKDAKKSGRLNETLRLLDTDFEGASPVTHWHAGRGWRR